MTTYQAKMETEAVEAMEMAAEAMAEGNDREATAWQREAESCRVAAYQAGE